jgi:hypothetical protein
MTQEFLAGLKQQGPVWIGHCRFGNRSDVEVEIIGDGARPSADHLKYAEECVARLTRLMPDLEAALNAVEEGHALFPPRQSRRWYLEGLSFTGMESRRGEALFTLDESDYEYIYVLYSVEIVNGVAGRVHAHAR